MEFQGQVLFSFKPFDVYLAKLPLRYQFTLLSAMQYNVQKNLSTHTFLTRYH